MQTTRGSWAPEDWLHLKARAHALEAGCTNALQVITKEKGTFRERRGRQGSTHHEKLAKALVDCWHPPVR